MIRGILIAILVVSGSSLAYGAENAGSAGKNSNCWITFGNKTGSALAAEAWSDSKNVITIDDKEHEIKKGTPYKFNINDGGTATVKVTGVNDCDASLQVDDGTYKNVTYVWNDNLSYSRVNCYKSALSHKMFRETYDCVCDKDTGNNHAKGTLVCSKR